MDTCGHTQPRDSEYPTSLTTVTTSSSGHGSYENTTSAAVSRILQTKIHRLITSNANKDAIKFLSENDPELLFADNEDLVTLILQRKNTEDIFSEISTARYLQHVKKHRLALIDGLEWCIQNSEHYKVEKLLTTFNEEIRDSDSGKRQLTIRKFNQLIRIGNIGAAIELSEAHNGDPHYLLEGNPDALTLASSIRGDNRLFDWVLKNTNPQVGKDVALLAVIKTNDAYKVECLMETTRRAGGCAISRRRFSLQMAVLDGSLDAMISLLKYPEQLDLVHNTIQVFGMIQTSLPARSINSDSLAAAIKAGLKVGDTIRSAINIASCGHRRTLDDTSFRTFSGVVNELFPERGEIVLETRMLSQSELIRYGATSGSCMTSTYYDYTHPSKRHEIDGNVQFKITFVSSDPPKHSVSRDMMNLFFQTEETKRVLENHAHSYFVDLEGRTTNPCPIRELDDNYVIDSADGTSSSSSSNIPENITDFERVMYGVANKIQ